MQKTTTNNKENPVPHFQNDLVQSAALSDEQFAELKKLLHPGYELSSLMLADYKAKIAAAADAARKAAAAKTDTAN